MAVVKGLPEHLMSMVSKPPELPKFTGTFYDGETAVEIPVTITLDTYGLSILRDDGSAEYSWSYEGLVAVEPVIAGNTNRIFHKSMPEVRLHCASMEFARLISNRAAHLTKGAETRRTATIVLTAIAGLLAIGATGYGLLTYAPEHLVKVVPHAAWSTFGNSVERQLTSNKKACSSKDGDVALSELSARLARGGVFERPPVVRVFDLPIVNAFATAGGRVVIGSKLIKLNKSPDELAGVLAHELAHVQLKHPETTLFRVFGLQMFVSLLTGGSGVGDFIGSVGSTAAILRYSRDGEREADALAQNYLNTAKINPKGLSKFFESVKGLDAKGEKTKKTSAKANEASDSPTSTSKTDEETSLFNNILSTHPGLDERIKKIVPMAGFVYNDALTQSQWTALKNICY